MNNIQNAFTIQDLEILTGIKAHTIRIWERRYDLLNPARLNRNIRLYELPDLQKILNVSLLYKHDYKISKLSKLSDKELAEEAKAIALDGVSNNYQINSLIVSMFTLDEALFQEVYLQQIKKSTFEEIFIHTYLPLLNHIGVLWQTEALRPAHEHFISNLIYQKIILHTASIKAGSSTNGHMHILFLPNGEMHEIGLLFLNYYLKRKGEKTIYLGRSVPIENLFYLNSQFKKITWVSSFLIDKPLDEKEKWISDIGELLLDTKNNCLVIGRIWKEFSERSSSSQISFFESFGDIISIN